MTAVAAKARVGKHTLYRRFPDKASLYREVIRRRMEEEVAVVAVKTQEPLEMLKALGAQALTVVTDPEFMALNRALVAEAASFPDLADVMVDYWERKFVIRFVEATRGAQQAGLCIAGDADKIARWYLGGVVGEPLRISLMRPGFTFPAREKKQHLASTWALFLRAITPAT